MDDKEIASLIRYHKDGLSQYRFAISPSAQVLEEQTIKALEELQSIKASSNSTAGPQS